MQAIAIYCGSLIGQHDIYAEQARLVGKTLAQQNITLVYGGGHVGLMGEVANACLAAGGKVVGVMTKHLVDKEIAHKHLTELYVVENMHQRKQKMADLADGFIALAGGAGTMEEMFEQWTWAQIGIHQKPCAFLNTLNYYDDLFKFIQHMANESFLKQDYADMLIKSDDIEEIIQIFRTYHAPASKWDKPLK
ncbi:MULTISPECIES: TIGR00730 family Rossman fold protein [unclassified Acinetobacter]|uniref:LOG family protein n=1 Tax=unclassified Acinetobacter TaxID=196816 RepID=UPI0035BAFB42